MLDERRVEKGYAADLEKLFYIVTNEVGDGGSMRLNRLYLRRSFPFRRHRAHRWRRRRRIDCGAGREGSEEAQIGESKNKDPNAGGYDPSEPQITREATELVRDAVHGFMEADDFIGGEQTERRAEEHQ